MSKGCRFPLRWLALVFGLSPAAAAAQTVPLDLEFGYRFLHVNGNRDMYRSQVNDRQGVLLHSLTFATTDFDGRTRLFDHLRLDASDLGAGPAGALRLEAGRAGIYALRFFYRRAELFSALPAFANPLLDQGIIPGQHTIDRVRNLFDAELELFPGRMITPIVGYTRNRYEGPGRTTYAVGANEFRLASDLEDTDQEFRVGAAFRSGPIAARVVQGWHQFKDRETSTLAPGEKNGNNPGPVLGVPVSLTNLQRDVRTKTNTPITSAFLTGQVAPRIKAVGAYVRANAESDSNLQEDLSGSLVSFQISRFFGGLSETTSSRARSTQWRGSGRVEVAVADGIDLAAGWLRRHRELDGFALISDLYLNTVTFSGQDPRNLLRLLETRTAMDRTEDVFDVAVNARVLGPVALRAGWSHVDLDVTVTPDPSEIVVPGGQGGAFNRRINDWRGGATFSQRGLTVGADYRWERANAPIVRTDFLDRKRYRLRASWAAIEWLRVGTTAEQIDTSNDRAGIGYDARIREYGGDLDVAPWKPLLAHFSANKYQADSTILSRRPQDFGVDTSVHQEDGNAFEGGLTLALPRFSIDGAYGQFKNKGSFRFTIKRARARGEFEVTKSISVVGEWAKDKYDESAQGLGNLGAYDADRYGLYIHWRQ